MTALVMPTIMQSTPPSASRSRISRYWGTGGIAEHHHGGKCVLKVGQALGDAQREHAADLADIDAALVQLWAGEGLSGGWADRHG
jgi:hypothetical protein